MHGKGIRTAGIGRIVEIIKGFNTKADITAHPYVPRSRVIIAVPAQWPEVRLAHWRTLLQARAIENQLFVIGAACCGRQGKIILSGHSMIIDPNGKILAEAEEKEETIVAEIDLDEVNKAREKIPCFKSRVPQAYN